MTKRAHYPQLLAIALLSLSSLLTPIVVSAADSPPIIASTRTNTSTKELSEQIGSRLLRVPEFDFIRHEAERLGVKAYLFGGTAAGYAHYVKWDMLREKGDKRYQPDRFDYDYTNIYRSTQDLDIVIDGNAEQAQKLQASLQEKYPHLQGSKTAWEVRLLTQDMGDKQAILNNPDFLNQHTDSNSTGMIEITRPAHGDPVVRDVRDWKSKEPYFLKDIQEGTLHYYFSPLHDMTKFAKEGRNPPILSAIRFLTKAFQYELKIKPDDLARIQKIIHDFDPKRDTQNSYVANWIEKNGKKLIQNAVNIEYARNTMDQLGLRDKLASIKDNPQLQESLSWWMNKEPLRSRPLGHGTGATARELGLDLVAHETRNYLAYESITRAHTGDPNVLVSRNGVIGEAAAYGDGFYVKTGEKGAKGTGLTIRFHLDPDARLGEDFDKSGDYVIVKNKSALKVIPESLSVSPLEYMEMISSGKLGEHSDLGIRERLERRISNKQNTLTHEDRKSLLTILDREAAKGRSALPFVGTFKKLFPNVFAQVDSKTIASLNKTTLNLANFIASHLEKMSPDFPWLMELMPKERAQDVLLAFLRLDTVHLSLRNGGFNAVFETYLSRLSAQELESAYRAVEPQILALGGPKIRHAWGGEAAFHTILMRHLVKINPDLIRPFLKNPSYPEVRIAAHEHLVQWEIAHQSHIPWLYSETVDALKSGNADEKRMAISYLKDFPLTDEIEEMVHNELRPGGRTLEAIGFFSEKGAKHPDSEKLIYDFLTKHLEDHTSVTWVAFYFKNHPPKDKAVLSEFITLMNGDRNLRLKFTDAIIEGARLFPDQFEKLEDTSMLIKANCQTENCIQRYLKIIDLNQFANGPRPFDLHRLGYDALEPLRPPMDRRIVDELGKAVLHPSVDRFSRQTAAFLYAKLDGKDPHILKAAMDFVDVQYFKRADRFEKSFPERKELRLKMEQGCLVQNLKSALEK